jgi:hypothetical protein
MGSVVLVVIIIAIVVTIDDRIYWADTVCGGGTLTFAKVRLGDWVLHGLPVVEVFLLMLFDYKVYMRAVLYHLLRSRSWKYGLAYSVFFHFAPSLPMLLYACIQDIGKRYPTSLSNAAFVFIAIALCLCTMGTWFVSLLVHVDEQRTMVVFYSAIALARARQHTPSDDSDDSSGGGGDDDGETVTSAIGVAVGCSYDSSSPPSTSRGKTVGASITLINV